jgi:hypothetical protein
MALMLARLEGTLVEQQVEYQQNAVFVGVGASPPDSLACVQRCGRMPRHSRGAPSSPQTCLLLACQEETIRLVESLALMYDRRRRDGAMVRGMLSCVEDYLRACTGIGCESAPRQVLMLLEGAAERDPACREAIADTVVWVVLPRCGAGLPRAAGRVHPQLMHLGGTCCCMLPTLQ